MGNNTIIKKHHTRVIRLASFMISDHCAIDPLKSQVYDVFKRLYVFLFVFFFCGFIVNIPNPPPSDLIKVWAQFLAQVTLTTI